MMKLYAPEYYKDFVCIADKCKHSCCIGWEIDIDSDTMAKYRQYKGNYAKELAESIDDSAEPCFKLDKNERCPHLDERGLCRLILNVGEDFLCHICREHPRFYNDTPKGREAGLGMACEEACRIILNSDDYAETLPLEDCDGEADEDLLDTDAYRKMIYSVLSDNCLTYPERLDLIAERYGIVKHSDEECRQLIDSLEYLDEAHRPLFAKYSWSAEVKKENEKYLERALAYFVYRHCAEAWDEDELCASVGFCLFCERLLAALVECGEDVYEAARIISEEIEYSEDNTSAIKNFFGN